MTARNRVCAALLISSLLAPPAFADGKHTLVLKSDGNADGKVRAQIDAAVLKLARGSVEGVAPGDISFADAAAAVGCKPDAPTCKDDVLGMLAVDEVIATTVTRKPGGLEVLVRRAPKSGAPREATAKISDASDATFDTQLGPLFGAAAPATTVTVIEPPRPDEPTPPVAHPTPPDAPPQPEPARPNLAEPGQPLAPMPQPAEDQQHTRLQLAGMIGGGGLVLLGFVLWGQASGTQNDIDNAPNRTHADLVHLQDLEKQGDGQASLGNLMFFGGLILGGISTYLFVRDRGRRHDPVARITPTLLDHGAGFALTGVLP